MKITVAIAENEQLFLRSLCLLIEYFEQFEVIATAMDGDELLARLSNLENNPDIILLDVNMPRKNGIETANAINELYPLAKMIALSVKDDDQTILNMIRAGCCAYLLKNTDPEEFKKSLIEVYEKGYYNGDAYNMNYRRIMRRNLEETVKVSANELEFLKLAGTDMTYRQIAKEMHLAERTIDGYREALFEKLKVQSRVGMVLEGIRKQIISI